MAGKVNCREASRLLSAGHERELSVAETVALKFHLAVCGMCRNFEAQLTFIHKAANRFRGGDGDE